MSRVPGFSLAAILCFAVLPRASAYIPAARSLDAKVRGIAEDLCSASASVRAKAKERLVQLGPKAIPALLKCRDMLRDRGYYENELYDVIRRMGKPAVRVLARSLLDLKLRGAALEAVLNMEKLATPAVPAVLQIAGDEDAEVRRLVVAILGRVGTGPDAMKVLLKRSKDEPLSEVRLRIMNALERYGPEAEEAIPTLISLIRDRTYSPAEDFLFYSNSFWEPGYSARRLLLAIGDKSVSPLVDLLENRRAHRVARIWAAKTLARFKTKVQKEIPRLVKILETEYDPNEAHRIWASRILTRIKTKDRKEMPRLLKLLERDQKPDDADLWSAYVDECVREQVLYVLEASRSTHPSLLSALRRRALSDRSAVMRAQAAWVLFSLQPDNKVSLPVLLKLANADRPPGNTGGLDELVAGGEIVGQIDYQEVRRTALSNIARMGSAAYPAVPDLIKLVKKRIRGSAYALGSIGPKAASAVPALIEALSDIDAPPGAITEVVIGINNERKRLIYTERDDLRAAAAWALGQIGPKAAVAVPALSRALGDSYNAVRKSAAQALGRIGPSGATAVPALTRALTDEYHMVRQEAATSLGNMGTKAASALPSLQRVAQSDKDPAVREAASQAIRQIRAALQALR